MHIVNNKEWNHILNKEHLIIQITNKKLLRIHFTYLDLCDRYEHISATSGDNKWIPSIWQIRNDKTAFTLTSGQLTLDGGGGGFKS